MVNYYNIIDYFFSFCVAIISIIIIAVLDTYSFLSKILIYICKMLFLISNSMALSFPLFFF